MSKKQLSFLLFIAMVSGCIQYILLTEYTLKNEKLITYENIKDYGYINLVYQNSHPRFDYFNGLWLMFGGIFWACIIFICETEKLFFYKKLKEKIKNDIIIFKNNKNKKC
jgi:hypothetical protein